MEECIESVFCMCRERHAGRHDDAVPRGSETGVHCHADISPGVRDGRPRRALRHDKKRRPTQSATPPEWPRRYGLGVALRIPWQGRYARWGVEVCCVSS